MDSATAGLIGAGIGASAGFAGTLLTNWLNLKKEKDQWSRNIEAERQKWLRDNLQETYGNCLYYLSKLLVGSEVTVDSGELGVVLAKEHQREFFLDYSEAQKWLGLLLIYHPSQGSSDYSMLNHQISIFSSDQFPKIESIRHLQRMIVGLASRDLRLHGGAPITS